MFIRSVVAIVCVQKNESLNLVGDRFMCINEAEKKTAPTTMPAQRKAHFFLWQPTANRLHHFANQPRAIFTSAFPCGPTETFRFQTGENNILRGCHLTQFP